MRLSWVMRPVTGFVGLMLILVALTGCQTMASAGTEPKTVCLVFKPITWSSKDTLETAKQVREHNAAWVSICGLPK